MASVILKGYILVAPEDLEAVQKELVTHRILTLKEPGCMCFEVIQCENNPCRFDVYKQFKDRLSFNKHQERVRSSTWGKISANVKRYYEIFE